MMQNEQTPHVWRDSRLSVIYTLSPLHVGSGRALGGIDLPIARDVVTQTPIIPGSALKGVMREALENSDNSDLEQIRRLFGPAATDIDDEKSGKASDQGRTLSAALLAFTESRLLAYPVRSLNFPYVHVTSLSLLRRLRRDAAVLGQDNHFAAIDLDGLDPGFAYTAQTLIDPVLVVEDLVYTDEQIAGGETILQIAQTLADLLPGSADAQALRERLVILPDADFQHLMTQGIPVAARTQLTSGKTTDAFLNPETGQEEKGNLWYEEYLPAECVFVGFVGERRQVNWGSEHPEWPTTAV